MSGTITQLCHRSEDHRRRKAEVSCICEQFSLSNDKETFRIEEAARELQARYLEA